MSQKTIYITIGILALVSIALFAVGFILIRQDKIPGVSPDIFGDTFPFGIGGEPRDVFPRTPAEEVTSTPRREESVQSFGALREISGRPVAGAVVFERDDKTFIRYIEKQTGHVYEIEAGSSRANRISNTTIPGIVRALWGKGGEQAVFQYLEDNNVIKTVSAKIITATSTSGGTLSGTFLLDNMRDVIISPNGQNMFYILSLGSAAIGTIASIDGTGREQIFDSPITEWNSQWIDGGTIGLLTKPSALANGFLYTLNIENESTDKLLGDIPGLTALISHDKSKIIFSGSINNSFETFIRDTKSGVTTTFPITTFPEKCVWGNDNITLYCGAPNSIPAGEYPDLWYQGGVSFSDTIWKIDTETGALNILAIPEDDARTEIDLIDPELSENETTLVFRNKKNSSLWSLQLAD